MSMILNAHKNGKLQKPLDIIPNTDSDEEDEDTLHSLIMDRKPIASAPVVEPVKDNIDDIDIFSLLDIDRKSK